MSKLYKSLFVVSAFLLLVFSACNLPLEGRTGDGEPSGPTNTDGAETVFIPGGTFWMGSASDDLQADDDEMPRHQVTVDGFYIYTHEVTNEMYLRCFEAGACMAVNVLEGGPTAHYEDEDFADHPVVGVDWVMGRDYCAWAGARLPTEAEWELASRSNDSLRYPWGEEEPDCERVDMFGCLTPPDTLEVGSLPEGNSVYEGWDMAGNAWEWVHDWYAEHYYTFSPQENPLGPSIYQDAEHRLKTVRGGGLYSEAVQMRTAARLGANAYRPFDDVGFRCVAMPALDLPEEYVSAGDRHERVPPGGVEGGGERVEDPVDDPEGTIHVVWTRISCPTDDGFISVVFGISTSVPTEFAFSLAGSPCECSYDEVREMLNCRCPTPEDYDDLPRLPGELCYENEFFSECLRGGHDKREDCDSRPDEPVLRGYALGCPAGGLFNITFEYETPVLWDTTRIDGVNIPCEAGGDFRSISCVAPDIRDGDHYVFYLHGTDEAGREYEWEPWVPVRDDCPIDEGDIDYDLGTLCWEDDQPTVQLNYWPEALGLESISVNGDAADCVGMAPGVLLCPLPDEPGSEAEVNFCFTGGVCFTETVTIPDCPGEHARVFFNWVDPACWPPDSAAADIHYSSTEQELVSADADGVSLTCERWGPGWYMCRGVPGAAFSGTTINFCLTDGAASAIR